MFHGYKSVALCPSPWKWTSEKQLLLSQRNNAGISMFTELKGKQWQGSNGGLQRNNKHNKLKGDAYIAILKCLKDWNCLLVKKEQVTI